MELRISKLEKLSERLTTVIEFQSKAQDSQGKAIEKILNYMSEMQGIKISHDDLQLDVNRLGGKVDQIYIDISSKEARMQKEIDDNTATLKDVITGNKDELKSLITNRLIWIIGVTLTGAMLIAQHFEGLHNVAIDGISKDIATISKTVSSNKTLGHKIDINLKNLSAKVDEHNELHKPIRGE